MNETVTKSVSSLVEAGAALLDQHRPGWAKEIDLKSLDMSDRRNCILGQLYPSYCFAIRALGLNFSNVDSGQYDNGFEVPNDESITYKKLGSEWRDIVKSRLQAR